MLAISVTAPAAQGGAISVVNQPLGVRDPLAQTQQIAVERIGNSGGAMAPLKNEHSLTLSSFMVDKYATVPFEITESGKMQRVTHTISDPNPSLIYNHGNLVAPNGQSITKGISDPGQASGWFEQRASVTESSTAGTTTTFLPADAGASLPATAMGLNYQGGITQVEYDGFQYHYFATDTSRAPSFVMTPQINQPTVPEPGSMVLCAFGFTLLVCVARRRSLVTQNL